MNGDSIKRWRDKHGVSRSELAWWLQVSKRTVDAWEIDRQAPAPYLRLALGQLADKGCVGSAT